MSINKISSLFVIAIICLSFHCRGESDLQKKAVLHFDASAPKSLQTDDNGFVRLWNCQNSSALLKGNNDSRPVYKLNALNGMPAVYFDGNNDFLGLEGFQSKLTQGSISMFVVAVFNDTGKEQYLLSTGEQLPFMRIYSDAQNYRIETGLRQFTRRCGLKLDEQPHLFEYTHQIPNDAATLWPGDFTMDGKHCGKIFSVDELFTFEKCLVGSRNGSSGFFKGSLAEIIIFDHKLTDEQNKVVRDGLAEKWGVKLQKPWALPADLPVLKETPVGPAGKFSSFGIYNKSPESPDGKRIAYIVLDEPFTKDKTLLYYSLWVCDADLKNHREVIKSPTPTNCHNGGFIQWVDNDSLAMCGSHGIDPYRKILVVNVDTAAIEHGPFTGGFLGDDNHDGKVLMNITSESELGEKGLYELDTVSGKVRCVAKVSDFAKFRDEYKWIGQTNINKWDVTHSMYSQDGSHIAFSVSTGSGGGQHLFTAKPDMTDLRVWGRLKIDKGADQPLHLFWYDSNTIMGADQDTEDGLPNDLFVKRWDRDANYIETLTGPGCHIGASPDRRWIASENFYRTEPVYLIIYEAGNVMPRALVFNYPDGSVTWGLNGHVNPSFSRDGKRLYYNRPVDGKLVQAYCCDFGNELE